MAKELEDKQTGGDLPVCAVCSRKIVQDEIALTKKLVNRGASEFYCISCLAKRFGVEENVLRKKIIQFRDMGCTLFSR